LAWATVQDREEGRGREREREREIEKKENSNEQYKNEGGTTKCLNKIKKMTKN